jgi:gamma-glutamylcyclotransferase (GGCT)/AIG2-like uncharacterized protein YtfP
MKTRVFTYGTLLRGEPNHRLLATSKFIGEATTKAEYTMVDCGYYPAILEGGKTAVKGEVFEVDERTLERLDYLEGVPSLYIRKTITLDDGTEAEVYILNSSRTETADLTEIESGDWLDYLVAKYGPTRPDYDEDYDNDAEATA